MLEAEIFIRFQKARKLGKTWNLPGILWEDLSRRDFLTGSGTNLHQIGNKKDKLTTELTGRDSEIWQSPRVWKTVYQKGKNFWNIFSTVSKNKTIFFFIILRHTTTLYFPPSLIGCSYAAHFHQCIKSIF